MEKNEKDGLPATKRENYVNNYAKGKSLINQVRLMQIQFFCFLDKFIT